MSLGVRVGDGCERLHDRLMRDLNVGIIECDEQWDFIAKKQKRVRQGDPSEFGDVPENISTSYVERFNLSSRMQMRRCTRLTNGFSKKLENHRAAISLWIAFYNFCRVHETLRCTPAMALGVTDHIWTIAELVAAALEPSDVPPLPRTINRWRRRAAPAPDRSVDEVAPPENCKGSLLPLTMMVANNSSHHSERRGYS